MNDTIHDLEISFDSLWDLNRDMIFLNHGSYGACPRAVRSVQRHWQDTLEAAPVQFFLRTYDGAMATVRERLGAFVGADPADIALISNASLGVNAVLRSLSFEPGDEILVTNVTYPACRNAAEFVAERSGASVVMASLPFPLKEQRQLTSAILDRVTAKTKLVLLDHITSATALVMPLEALVTTLEARGVEVLVDGAHAPGQLPLNLDQLGASYYTGNCHKWMCTPKGSAFLYVRPDRQASVHPLTISHGASIDAEGVSRFRLEFDWVGTHDPSALLSIPAAIDHLGDLLPQGWSGLMQRNHALARAAQPIIADALGTEPLCPDDCFGAMVAFPLAAQAPQLPRGPRGLDPLAHWLWTEHRIDVPVGPVPFSERRFLRISAQLHNKLDDYRRLAEALRLAPFSH